MGMLSCPFLFLPGHVALTCDLTQYEPGPARMTISNQTNNSICGLPSFGPDQTGGLLGRLASPPASETLHHPIHAPAGARGS